MESLSAKKIPIGLVGAGFMGENHLRNLITLSEVTIVGVFDSDPSKARALAEKYRVPPAQSLHDLLKQAEAVVICVPTTAHYDAASEAVRNGCHVFLEKPFTHTVDEARSLCRLADKYKVHIQVGHVERFNPVIQTLLKSVRYENLLMGEFYRYVPLRKNIDADVLLTLMVHDLDLILRLADQMKTSPVRLAASGRTVYPEEMNRGLIDNAMVQILFDSSFLVNVHAVRTGALHRRKIILTETDRTWVADLLNHRLHLFTRLDRHTKQVDHRTVEIPATSPLLEEIKHFVSSVRTGRPPLVTQHDGLNVMKFIERIRSKMKTGSDAE
ncbi:Gfo/Idh/MocA family protein [Planifilum fimeticola]|uniref:Gfo/Idh/MocA family protein n=1 Tax=Planifilum fimeticola TaxID=201975 RepID=UPI000D06E9B8|nr:Gfo/Idh/MocA family oxidoreductase [Planifilum fimeticola]